MKLGWVDVRSTPEPARAAVLEAAVHARLDGIVDDDPGRLAALPPTIRRVLLRPATGTQGAERAAADGAVDLVLTAASSAEEIRALAGERSDGCEQGAYVHVVDQQTLDVACLSARVLPWTAVRFRDPTRIPLEIVIAAGDAADTRVVSFVDDGTDAELSLATLEKGSDGVALAADAPAAVATLTGLLGEPSPDLALATLTVDGIEHLGVGHRVCVDTCTHLRTDEGMLVGSFARGFVLCASETHPLPYMPTRPFRVNAGALQSYVLGPDNRTNYLSELEAGHVVLAVDARGRTRRVIVGRAKIEERPLLCVRASAADGTTVTVIVQDDWHVRVLAPGGAVRNVTALAPGDEVLGCLVADQRHVGWPVDEFCLEQ